ncbi:MAG: F0F1 ATP synthase subunit B [Clostridia bacterium]|nr:F0F1 ATP synthase subunit B [Clostridia bacterium]
MTNQLLAILDLDGLDVIAHLVNFLILVVVVGFLVYKPMVKLIHTRQDSIRKQMEEGKEQMKNAEALKEEYEGMIAKSAEEIALKKAEAERETAMESDAVLQNAKAEAAKILEKAEEEAKEEKAAAIADMKGDIVSIATMIASGILSREITPEEDAKIIDDCLNEWSEQ